MAIYVSVNATPNRVESGRSFALTWNESVSSPDVMQTCTASGAWSGSQPTSGNQIVTAGDPGDALYTLQCGSVQTTAVVQVAPGIGQVAYQPSTGDVFELILACAITYAFLLGYRQGNTR